MDPSNRVYLLTFTFPHERDAVALSEMVERFVDAEAAFKRSRKFERILGMKSGNRAGSVRSLEVTRGAHGWHPHAHYLVFAKAGLFAGAGKDDNGRLAHESIDELRLAWCNALLKTGLCEQRQVSDVMTYGLDVRGGDYASEYIAKFGHEQKWGLSSEVTLHVAKTGSDEKGAHPFQLLRWAGERVDDRADEAGRLFREYADAFTGKRMLTWSPKLKALLLKGVDEMTDEEAAEREVDAEEDAGFLDSEQLSVLHSREGLGRLLAIVAECGSSGAAGQQLINDVVDHFRRQPIEGHGVVKEKLRCRGYAYYNAEVVAA